MDSGASIDSQPSSFTISGLTKFRLPLLLLFCLSGCLPTDGCFAAPGPRERGATRITLLATSEEEEEEEEEDECGVAEENIDFRRTDPERKDRKRRQTAAKRMGDCNCGNVTLLVVGADKG